MAKSYDEIVSQMTEDIKSIREASLGVEVREHIASGMENVLEIFKRLPDAVNDVISSVPPDYTALVNRVADLESCGLTVENGKLCAVYDDGTGGDVSVEHVALGYPSMAMTVGESQPVSAIVSPEDATDKTVTWSVSPEECAKVEGGALKATKYGECTLTATAGEKTTSCPVTVSIGRYAIITAATETGEIPAWNAYPSHAEFFVPLTAKKSGLLLHSMSFRIKGFVAGKSRAILRKTADQTPLVDLSLELIRGYNDVTLDMGDFLLEKGVEYQLYMSAVNNFYPPSVKPEWVVENDFIDIANASAYYDGETTLIFAGTVELIQEEDNG